MKTIEIQGLQKKYKSFQVLENINLSIGPGLFGLLGPNGAGKSTLMKILSTFMPYDQGCISIYGQDVKENPMKVKQIIGYLPQHFQAPPKFTGKEFLSYVASLKGVDNQMERNSQVEKALKEVNLLDQANKRIKSYSGGMKRRLGIAQALLGNPKLLLFDEPTAGLDPAERIRLRNLIEKLSKDRTIFLSTHIISDIESSCEHVAILQQGKIKFHDSVKNLASRADGVVWEFPVSIEEYDQVEATYQVTSSRRDGKEVIFRVIQKNKLIPNAEQVTPTIEDGYIAVLNGVSDHEKN